MQRARLQKVFLLAAAGCLLAGGAHTLRGHGAVIRLAASAVAAGDSLGVTGEGLGVHRTIALRLEGAAFETPLVTVRGDAHGRFTVKVNVPAATPAGTYHIVATAGELTAASDLLVTSAAAATTTSSIGPPPPPLHASAERIALARRRTAWELGAAAALVLLLAAAGIWLAYPDPGGTR